MPLAPHHTSIIALILAAASIFLLSCQSDQQPAAQVSIRPAGIIGDTTGPWAGRANIFDTIAGLATGPDENLYVLDKGYEEIRMYSPEGELLTSILLTVGEGSDAVPSLEEFAVGPEGRFYVASTNGQEVARLTLDGVPTGEFAVSIRPTDIAASAGEFYLTGSRTAGALVPGTSKREEDRVAFLEASEGPGKIVRADSLGFLAVTDRGTLIYSFQQAYRMVEFSPRGEILREASGQPSFSGGPEQNAEGVTATDQRSSGLAIVESGHVVNMVRDQAAGMWYADVFTPDLKFIQRIERETFGFERFRHVTAVGTSLYLSSPHPAPHIRRFDISIE